MGCVGTYWDDVLLLSEIMFYREAICEERPVIIDGLMGMQEYGSNNADVQCLQRDVSQNTKLALGWGRMNTFCSVCKIGPVGPTWTHPGLFNKIQGGLWMACWPLCPWGGGLMTALRIPEPSQACDSANVSQVAEYPSNALNPVK